MYYPSFIHGHFHCFEIHKSNDQNVLRLHSRSLVSYSLNLTSVPWMLLPSLSLLNMNILPLSFHWRTLWAPLSFSSNHSQQLAVLHFLQKLSCLGTYQEQLFANLEGKPTMLCFGEGSWRSEKVEALKASRGLRWRVSRGTSEKKETWPDVSLPCAFTFSKGCLGLSRPKGPEAVRVSVLAVDTSPWSYPWESCLPPGRDKPLSPDPSHIPPPWLHPFSHTENDLWVPWMRGKKLKLLKQSLGGAVWKTATVLL